MSTQTPTQFAVCPACSAINRVPTERAGKEINCGHCHRPLFGQEPLSLDQAAFNKQISKSEVPVVVDFWAPWCGPCRMMAPAYAQVAARMAADAQFVKVNTEDEQALGAQYNIRSIPTLAVFKGGQEVARISGALPAASLEQWVRQAIGA